jgi:hypothetical protein
MHARFVALAVELLTASDPAPDLARHARRRLDERLDPIRPGAWKAWAERGDGAVAGRPAPATDGAPALRPARSGPPAI